MGRIHVLPDQVANKIAAGEVVERPASVVKELLENALDAGARRIKLNVEAGGKKLIYIADDGSGMLRDDALLAFERHATSKIKDVDDLLHIATLGFRGEALPSIASVSRLTLETRCQAEQTGTLVEVAGGKMLRVEDAGLPLGTSIAVRDLFFNVPARKKFLKAESTELSHIASLVTHYALAHPDKHFELHSTSNAVLVAPPVAGHRERIYQIFGRDTLDELIPLAAVMQFERVGLPQPPPWRRDPEQQPPEPGELRLHGFVSKPEIQKLNRNSIFIFVNGRLVRDRLIQHALTEAYRNILPANVYPVVLLFLEMPTAEVDVNVHPSKTEVRFRQQQAVHDFVRDSTRAALLKARPVPHFVQEISAQPRASTSLTPGALPPVTVEQGRESFTLQPPPVPPLNTAFQFEGSLALQANAAQALALAPAIAPLRVSSQRAAACGGIWADDAPEETAEQSPSLHALRPLGQIRNSFILAVDDNGLWIIDQHVAHERVLFEGLLGTGNGRPRVQRLLMPLIVELTPAQQAVFTQISEQLQQNGFEIEPFGARTIAVKAAPAGIEAGTIEKMLHELLDCFEREEQSTNLDKIRSEIAASIACHAAIKVNMPLEQAKMEWLLRELAATKCPMSCPHGRPVVLRYTLRDIQKAFKRI
ncbi:MAG: DNA mismatch repair endonuclease MutL [Acidobacteriales bacterium]|nr:DNA mismatch repair endonuclease MutL [Terriglobales bacterium]